MTRMASEASASCHCDDDVNENSDNLDIKPDLILLLTEMTRPRVVLVAATLEPGNGGIGRLARLTARVLAQKAAEGLIEARAVTLADAEPQNDLGIPVWTAARSRMRFVAEVQRAAITDTHLIYDSLGPARAHCLVPGLRKPFLAWICGIEIWPEANPPRLKRLRFKWAARADKIVSISDYTTTRSGLDAEVCWPGTESDDALSVGDVTARPPRVLALGRVDESDKGHHALVKAWPDVVRALPNAILTFVGKGPKLHLLKDAVERSGVGGNIEILGFVPDDALEAIWSQSRVFALPSVVEGFGLVYVEAMRHGIPVVATVHDAGGEINVDGETGFNVNLNNAGELAARLITLLSDDNLARTMGQHGLDRWRRSFRFGAFSDRFGKILDRFVGTPPSDTGPAPRGQLSRNGA